MKHADPIIDIAALREWVCNQFTNTPYNTHHLDHLSRVNTLCQKIGQAEKADLVILEAAALLHDIARANETESTTCHAIASVQIAADILAKLAWPPNTVDAIAYAIRMHRYSAGITPETIEAKILQDADRLDALGAIGLARVLGHGLVRGEPLYLLDSENSINGPCTIAHFHEKILKLKDGMHTATAKQIAEERHNIIVQYLSRLENEITAP